MNLVLTSVNKITSKSCVMDEKLGVAAQFCSFANKTQGKIVTCIFEMIWLAVLIPCMINSIKAMLLKSCYTTHRKCFTWLVHSTVGGQLYSWDLYAFVQNLKRFGLNQKKKKEEDRQSVKINDISYLSKSYVNALPQIHTNSTF